MASKEKKGSESEKKEVEKKEDPNHHKHGLKKGGKVKKVWQYVLFETIYVLLAVVTIILSLAIISYAIYAVVEILRVTADRSGLIVALCIIVVCAALTVSILGYASYYVVKRYPGIAIFASFALLIPFLVQASLVGTVVSFSLNDEQQLFHSLSNLFTLSRGFQIKYAKQYHNLEYSLKCCGLYDPNDYRLVYFDQYHPPDVPISCCSTYNPVLPDSHQEEARQICLNDRSFYNDGCKDLAIAVVKKALGTLQLLDWPVLVLDIILMALGLFTLFLIKRYFPDDDNEKSKKDENEEP